MNSERYDPVCVKCGDPLTTEEVRMESRCKDGMCKSCRRTKKSKARGKLDDCVHFGACDCPVSGLTVWHKKGCVNYE